MSARASNQEEIKPIDVTVHGLDRTITANLLSMDALDSGRLWLQLADHSIQREVGWQADVEYRASANATSLCARFQPCNEPLTHQTPTANEEPALPLEGIGSFDDVLYKVTFKNREIRVNGALISRPHFNSENEVAFEYIFSHPNRRIELAELEEVKGAPLNKSISQILRDLGFKGELRKLFFLGVAKSGLHFVNPVTRRDFEKRGLPRAKFPPSRSKG